MGGRLVPGRARQRAGSSRSWSCVIGAGSAGRTWRSSSSPTWRRDVIWLEGEVQVDTDLARQTLRHALSLAPGDVRGATLVAGLAARGRMLDDDMYRLGGSRAVRPRGPADTQAVVHWMTVDIHERRGDPAAALAERDAELVLLATIGNLRNTAVAHAAKARLLAELGRQDDAAAAATSARTAAEKVSDEAFSASIDQQLRALSTSHY